jgi:hypothetical protein
VGANLIHPHFHATVVKQQNIASVNVFNQFGIVKTDPTLIAESALDVEYKPVTLAQFDRALRKFSDPDLGALQIGKDANVAPKARRETPHKRNTRRMFLGCPMRKVHPDHIDSGGQNPLKHFRMGRRRTKGRDNFGRTMS